MDGARSIIDQEEEARWSNIKHYYINKTEKEQAKEVLGFNCVPFYVAVNKDGIICDTGGPKSFDLARALRLFQQSKENQNPTNLIWSNGKLPYYSKGLVLDEEF